MTDDTDPTPRPTTAAQEAELALWRARALEAMPYFAPLLFSLRVLDAPGLGTFAVDARHRLYVDLGAIAAWSALENAEALVHECGHLLRDHAGRADVKAVREEERAAWNVAADAMLNLDLVRPGRRPDTGGALAGQVRPDGLTFLPQVAVDRPERQPLLRRARRPGRPPLDVGECPGEFAGRPCSFSGRRPLPGPRRQAIA